MWTRRKARWHSNMSTDGSCLTIQVKGHSVSLPPGHPVTLSPCHPAVVQYTFHPHLSLTYFIFNIAQLRCFFSIIRESELRRSSEGTNHEDAEHDEADSVVLLPNLGMATWMIVEGVWGVQRDAHDEHGNSPSNRPEHPLLAIVLCSGVIEWPQRGGVC